MKAQRSKHKKKFKDLSRGQRIAVLTTGTVQLALLVLAEVDIQHRRADRIRGRKGVWRMVCLINFVGPLSYFKWGRR